MGESAKSAERRERHREGGSSTPEASSPAVRRLADAQRDQISSAGSQKQQHEREREQLGSGSSYRSTGNTPRAGSSRTNIGGNDAGYGMTATATSGVLDLDPLGSSSRRRF